MPLGTLQILPFSPTFLTQQFFKVESASREYLYEYLTALGARCLLVEGHYVDRHFLDEYAEYYARSFEPPTPPACSRLHFFSESDADVAALFEEAYSSIPRLDNHEAVEDALRAIERRIQAGYLGFVVYRPLTGAPMGRTVLKTYPVAGRRHYEVVRTYRVHLGGLTLTVNGLAYQQQDRGAAACASTALWSALQRVAVVAGHRTPTPFAVTRAAESPYAASAGLDYSEMARALSNLGYGADTFAPEDNRALFRAKVAACLESRLPVILMITSPMGGHAVTVTGFSEPATLVDVLEGSEGSMKMRSGSLSVVYVHDDNLGSHAHYELFDSEDADDDGNRKLMLRRGSASLARPWWTIDECEVLGALVPKPAKLRLPIENLFGHLLDLQPAFEDVIFPAVDLHFSARFESGIDYKRSLFKMRLDDQQMQDFQEQLALPRYIGVISVWADDDVHLCDAVIDVSEISRDPYFPSVIGIVAPGVPLNSQPWIEIKAFAQEDIPTISASETSAA